MYVIEVLYVWPCVLTHVRLCGGERVEHELELECLCTSIDECEYGKE